MNSNLFLNQTQSIFNNKLYKKNLLKNNSKENKSFFSVSQKKFISGDKNLKISVDLPNNLKLLIPNNNKYLLNHTEENLEKKNQIHHKSVFSQDNLLYPFNNYINYRTRNSNLNPYSTEKKNNIKKRNNYSMRLKNKNPRETFYSSNISPNVSNAFLNIITKNDSKKFIVDNNKLIIKEDEKVDYDNHKKIDRKKFLGLLESNIYKNQNIYEKPFKLNKNNRRLNLDFHLDSPEELHFFIINKIQKVKNLNNNIN